MVPDVALAALGTRELLTGDEDLVFPGDFGEYMDGSALRDRYKRALARAGLRELRLHDLRHTSGLSPSVAPRSPPSRRGWVTRQSRRSCATSTTGTVAARLSCSPKRSGPRRTCPRRAEPSDRSPPPHPIASIRAGARGDARSPVRSMSEGGVRRTPSAFRKSRRPPSPSGRRV